MAAWKCSSVLIWAVLPWELCAEREAFRLFWVHFGVLLGPFWLRWQPFFVAFWK